MKAEKTNIIEIENFQTNKEFLAEELAFEIKEYVKKERFTEHGINKLAKLAGLTPRSLKRYMYRESYPTLNSALKIYMAKYSFCRTIEDFEERLPARIIDILKQSENFLVEDKKAIQLDEEFNESMTKDQLFRKIYNYVSMSNEKHPLTRFFIRFSFGEMGEDKLDEMLKMGILSERDNVISFEDCASPVWNDETYFHNAINLVKENFKPEKMQEADTALAGYYCSSVSEDAYQKLVELEKEFFKEVQKITGNRENDGEVKFYLANFLDKVA